MDDSRIERLMQDLIRGELEVRWSAVRSLVEIGEPAVPALCEALRDKDRNVRCRAVVALGWIGATSAVPSVCEALKDGDRYVRRSATRALVEIGDSHAVSSLCEVLKGGDREVRELAVEALVKIGAPAVPSLCEALKDEESDVRRLTAEALGKIAERDPVPELLRATPLLRRLAGIGPSESKQEKKIYQSAIERIEAATAEWKHLPLPAEEPMPSAEQLPRPATSPTPDRGALPIPSTASDTPPLEKPQPGPGLPRKLWQRLVLAVRRLQRI